MLGARQFVLGIALLFALVVDSNGQPSKGSPNSNPPPTQSAQQPAADQRGTDQSPLSIKILPGSNSEERAEKEEHERQEKVQIDEKVAFETQRVADYTRWLAAFTLALFCAALGQIVLFWVQLRYMRVGTNDTGVAALAAQSSADIAKQSMVSSNRAYVHHNGCRWISHTDTKDGHNFWSIRPRWINSGNTPTRHLSVHIQYLLLDAALDPKYAFDIPLNAVPVFSTIAPKGEIESEYYNISGADLIAVRDEKKFFYIWGVVRYRDVFPKTPERITKFCVQAKSVTGNPNKGWNATNNPVEILLANYHRHNCSDEDCGPN
jgi:hypothetical protein